MIRLLGAAVLIKRARAACRWRDFVSIWLGGQQPQNQNGHPARNRRAMKLEWFEGFRDRSAAKEVYRLASVLQELARCSRKKREARRGAGAASWVISICEY